MLRTIMLIIISLMVSGCFGDPVYSIKHTITFEGDVSHDCIHFAANNISKDVSVVKIEDEYGKRDFDEYIITGNNAEIEVLWFRGDRNKIEMSTLGIGFADKDRDTHTCNLISSFEKAMIKACAINQQTIDIKVEYIRSSCSGSSASG